MLTISSKVVGLATQVTKGRTERRRVKDSECVFEREREITKAAFIHHFYKQCPYALEHSNQ